MPGVFSGRAGAVFQTHSGHVQPLLLVEHSGQLRFGHTGGQQPALPARKHQLQIRALPHQIHWYRHAFGCLTQWHLGMGGKAVRVTDCTTQHDDANMAIHHLSRRYGIAVFQGTQQCIGNDTEPQQTQHHQPAPEHEHRLPAPAHQDQQRQRPPQCQLSAGRSWSRVVYIRQAEMDALARRRHASNVRHLHQLLGSDHFDDIYLARDQIGLGSPILLDAYSDARKHAYGDSLGLVGQSAHSSVFRESAHAPWIARCRALAKRLLLGAAESLGSYYKGRHTGNFGRIGVLSFNGNKIMTTGGGGMLLTDETIGKRAKHLTTTAKIPHPYEFVHDEVGYNYRLPNLNAALGCAQLEQLPAFLASKRTLAVRYIDFFKDSDLQPIVEPEHCHSNYWLNGVICETPAQRDALLKATNDAGVMTRPIWALMNRLPLYANAPRGPLDNAEWLEARVVNLPSSVSPA